MDKMRSRTVIVRGVGDATSPGVVIARAFAQEGASIALAGASKSRMKAASDSIRALGADCLCIHLSCDDIDGIGGAVERIAERFGRIDVLVNAALTARPQLANEIATADLEKAFRCDVEAPFAWMQACLSHLASSKGTVISLGSRCAQEAVPGFGSLAAATQGFQALNAIAAQEWAELGVSSNIVQAAARNTRLDRWRSEFETQDRRPLDMPHGGELPDSFDELARTCLYLASEEGHSVTGQTLSVW